MHTSRPFQDEIRFIGRDGTILARFPSVKHAAVYAKQQNWLHWWQDSPLGDEFLPIERCLSVINGRILWTKEAGPKIVCRTATGDIIPVSDLFAAIGRRQSSSPWWYRYGKFKFRRGPVEGVHKYVNGGYYRSPRCQQALRNINDGLDEAKELGFYRASRSRDIVTAWDDIGRTRNHNWKEHRKTRWKTK